MAGGHYSPNTQKRVSGQCSKLSWSDTYHIINDNHSGIRQGMSTVDNIYILQSVIHVAFNRGKKVSCASIDFSKAFDYINRDCLWYKLLKSGIRGNIFNIIKSMYMNTFSKVKYQGAMSDQFECNIGGFQGIMEGAFNLRSLTLSMPFPDQVREF